MQLLAKTKTLASDILDGMSQEAAVKLGEWAEAKMQTGKVARWNLAKIQEGLDFACAHPAETLASETITEARAILAQKQK